MSTLTTTGERTRILGLMLTASGVGGIVLGALTIVYPPAVADDVRGYPFPYAVSLVVGIALAIVHLMTAAGFRGIVLAGPHGASRAAAAGLWVAVAGFVILTVAELVSSWQSDEPVDSGFSSALDTVFGVSSVLTAVGSVIAGVVIARRRSWTGLARWSVLASGLVMILLVIPALISGSLVLSMSALMLWSATFIPIGIAVRA